MRPVLLLVTLAACGGDKPSPRSPTPEPSPAPAPEPAPAAGGADSLATSAGEVTFRPLHHATLALEHLGETWVFDPSTDAPLEGIAADVVLITDIHGDHLDPKAIDEVRKEGTLVVGPAAVGEKIPLDVTLANGETREIAGLRVTGIPMYNLVRGPEPGKLFHDEGRGNGYLVEIGDARIYVAGDTECVPEIEALTGIDVAFLPMNLPYTMPPEEAVACARAFEPKILYPYHYGESDLSGLEAALAGSGIELRQRDWYPTP